MRVSEIALRPDRPRPRLAVSCVLCLLCLGAAPTAQAGSAVPASAKTVVLDYSLRLDTGPAPELAGRRVGTFAEGVRAFGRPALVVSSGALSQPSCTASWPKLALEIDFSTARRGACAARDLGRWLTVRASAPRWHTPAGLRVGDTERRLHSLYPTARRLDFLGMGSLWELETGGPLCDGGPPLAVAGRVRAGHLNQLAVVHVPACG